MPAITVNEGRHMTAEEYVRDANGALLEVRRSKLYFTGETIPALGAAEYAALVTDPKTKDTKRFTDKGKS